MCRPCNVWRAPFAPNGRCCRRCFPHQLMCINWHITRKSVKMYQSPVHEAVLCQSRNCLFSWMSSQRNAWRGIALESPWAALPKPQGGRTPMIPEVYSRVIVTHVTAPNDLGSILCTSIFTIQQYVSVRSSYFSLIELPPAGKDQNSKGKAVAALTHCQRDKQTLWPTNKHTQT